MTLTILQTNPYEAARIVGIAVALVMVLLAMALLSARNRW